MATYPNSRYASSSPRRLTGGAAPGYEASQSSASARLGRFTGETWAKTAGFPFSGILPLVPGALSAFNTTSAGITVAPAYLGTSYSLYALPANPTITLEPAPITATGKLAGTVSANASVAAITLGSIANISGAAAAALTVASSPITGVQGLIIAVPITTSLTTNATLSSNSSSLAADVFCALTVSIAELTMRGSLTAAITTGIIPAATLSATGTLAGNITPYAILSPESIAQKISETLSPESIAASVQSTLAPRLDNIEQKVGITLALAASG